MFLPITASSQIYQTHFEDAQLKKGPQGGIVYVLAPSLGSVAWLKHLNSAQALFKAFKPPRIKGLCKNQETDPHNILSQLPDVDG